MKLLSAVKTASLVKRYDVNDRRFRALIENSADMFTLSTRDGKIFYSSPSVTKVFGFSPEEIMDTATFGFLHPDEREQFLKNREQVLKVPGSSCYSQLRLVDKKGNWIWCEGTITNHLDEPGIHAIVSNLRDISEKKQAQQLRKFERINLEALINNTPDLIWSVDTDFNLITANEPFDKVMIELSGKKVEKGNNMLHAALSPDQSMRYKKYYERAFAGETFIETDYMSYPVEAWSEISFYPIRNGDEIIGTACHSRDITERKKAEAAIIRNEKRSKEAQAIAHLGNWEMNFATGKAIWSEEACRIYGLPVENTVHSFEEWKSFIHPDDVDEVIRSINESQRTLAENVMSHRIILSGGSVKHILSVSRFEFDHNGEAVGLYGISHDVTEQKIAEQVLKQSEERYRQIVETAQEAIWLIDQDNKTVFINRRFSEIFGYPADEMLGAEVYKLIDEENAPIIKAKLEKRKTGIAEDYEQEYVSKSGKRIWANVSASPIMGDDGKYLGGLAMLTDITERKQAEAEKEKMSADLLRRNQNLEQFTYIVSHNLRAPVANILGATDLLTDPVLNTKDKEPIVAGLHESAVKLDTVVRDLNMILQVKQQLSEAKTKISFSGLMEDIKAVTSGATGKDHVEICYDFSAIDEMVSCKSFLYSIFFNLVSNSIKYSRPEVPAMISIKSYVADGVTRLTFTDNGMGIDLSKNGTAIFGLYKKFHMHVEGKGMGLFMVKTQVEALGGNISVTSEPGMGTEFTVTFRAE